jgi:hypothetical protein
MFKTNKKNIAAFTIALVITIGFLWAVLTPPSVFNFLPSEIHNKSMRSSGISENQFIKIFDICSAIIVLILSYIIARNGLTAYRIFELKKPRLKE